MGESTGVAQAETEAEVELTGVTGFVDAETREILNLLGETENSGGCCGSGGCCSA